MELDPLAAANLWTAQGRFFADPGRSGGEQTGCSVASDAPHLAPTPLNERTRAMGAASRDLRFMSGVGPSCRGQPMGCRGEVFSRSGARRGRANGMFGCSGRPPPRPNTPRREDPSHGSSSRRLEVLSRTLALLPRPTYGLPMGGFSPIRGAQGASKRDVSLPQTPPTAPQHP